MCHVGRQIRAAAASVSDRTIDTQPSWERVSTRSSGASAARTWSCRSARIPLMTNDPPGPQESAEVVGHRDQHRRQDVRHHDVVGAVDFCDGCGVDIDRAVDVVQRHVPAASLRRRRRRCRSHGSRRRRAAQRAPRARPCRSRRRGARRTERRHRRAGARRARAIAVRVVGWSPRPKALPGSMIVTSDGSSSGSNGSNDAGTVTMSSAYQVGDRNSGATWAIESSTSRTLDRPRRIECCRRPLDRRQRRCRPMWRSRSGRSRCWSR